MGGEGGWIIIDKTIGASQEGQNMEETEITLNNITRTHLDNKLSSITVCLLSLGPLNDYLEEIF